MVTYDTNLKELGISDDDLNKLHQQSIYTAGDLLISVNQKTGIKTNKITAIKELRAVTGLGLLQSKEIADLGLPPISWTPPHSIEADALTLNHKTELSTLAIPPETLKILHRPAIYHVGELLRAVDNVTSLDESKLAFIKTFQEMTGLGLKDSKEIADLGLPHKSWKPSSVSNTTLSEPIDYNTKLTALQIPENRLKILQKPSVYTVGELLEAVDEADPLKDNKTAFTKTLKEWTNLDSEKCTAIVNLGLPKKPSTGTNNEDDPSEIEKLIESLVAEYYLTFPDILAELGKGIEQTQRELDMHSVEVQNIILKNKELADYGLNATWYTMPDIQFKLLMEYSINEQTRIEGTSTKIQKKVGIIPSNTRYDILFDSKRKIESTLTVIFKQIPPPPMEITRTEVPNLLGMTKKEAETVLQEKEIEAIFEQKTKLKGVNSEMKVVQQNVNPGDFLLEGDTLTIYIEN